MEIKCDYFGTTDLGLKRPVNQDRILVTEMQSGAMMLVVADGMGGEAAGDRAAELVVHTIQQVVMNGADASDLFGAMESMVTQAQGALEKAVAEQPELESMGSTLTMACCQWPDLYVVHVGDSRCYLLRDGQLSRLTNDHTVAQRFVEEGVISEEEAETSPMAHQLWNVVTSERAIKPERHQTVLQDGDAIVLCSDGLTKHVEDVRIAEVLGSADSAESACHELIELAKQGGGTDNIAVVVGRFSQ